MSELTTLSNVKQWLNVQNTNDDALLGRLIISASNIAEAYMGRTIASQAYTYIGDGKNNRRIVLPFSPVTAVASVTINGQAIPLAADNTKPGYFFYNGMVNLNGYAFSGGLGNVQIAYTAGFAAIPADIDQAVCEMVGYKYREKERIGMSSQNFQTQSTSYKLADIPVTSKLLFDQYKIYIPTQ